MAARWAVFTLLALVGGFMTLDGSRALVVGDYITPSSGDYAGQLGPWSKVVSRVGVDPRSSAMKVVFIVLGLFHLSGAVAILVLGTSTAVSAGLAAAVLGLWYLPFGTLADCVVMVIVALSSLRPWG